LATADALAALGAGVMVVQAVLERLDA